VFVAANGDRLYADDAPLHDWHAAWIDDLVARHEGEDPQDPRPG
jgi:hypothetical protein